MSGVVSLQMIIVVKLLNQISMSKSSEILKSELGDEDVKVQRRAIEDVLNELFLYTETQQDGEEDLNSLETNTSEYKRLNQKIRERKDIFKILRNKADQLRRAIK